MPKPNVSEFEEIVRGVVNVPESKSAFLDQLRTRFVSTGVPALQAKISTRPGVWSLYMKRGLVAVSILVFALLATSPAVADILQSLLGYIPGVGLVDENAPVLVLAEPIVIQREGVTLSVEQAVATTEKTVVIYRHIESQPFQPVQNYAVEPPRLRLPDGSQMEIITARRLATDGEGILYALDFGPLPPDVREVTLELATLAGLRAGEAPENWEVTIRFEPGELSEITFPVFEPAATLEATSEGTEQAAHGISLAIDKVVEMPDGYLLMGMAEWTDGSVATNALQFDVLSIEDANGQPVEFEYAGSERVAGQNELRSYWANKILTKDFAAPLTLNFYVKEYITSDARFQFDPGPNPQHGQIWNLNLDVPVSDRVVKILSAEYSDEDPESKFFRFTMVGEGISGAQIIDVDHPPLGFGGGGVPSVSTIFTTTVRIEGDPPYGPMTFSIVQLELLVPGDWTIMWDSAQP